MRPADGGPRRPPADSLLRLLVLLAALGALCLLLARYHW